ncbi:MAG: circadian clock KaiB family protein [Methanomassiliicoccus sp.]|nr:circadian clock KaiB family protein [Methanomassiliicoccus sp.]
MSEASKTDPSADVRYILRLYVTGMTPRAQDAIRNIRKICEEELKGRYELQIIDIYQQPELAKKEQILAAPTLIRELPLPLRKLVGDMSNKEKVVLGLEILPGKTDKVEGMK